MEEQSTPQSQVFVDYLYAQAAAAIEQLDTATASDVYALWLMLIEHDRVLEVGSLDYATRSDLPPDLTDKDRATWSPGRRTGTLALGLCRPAPGPFDDPEDSADLYGIELWEAYWRTRTRRFEGTEAENRALHAHATLQWHRNTCPDQFTPQLAAYLDRLEAVLRVTPPERAELEDDGRYLVNRYRQERREAMLAAYIQVAQRLHTGGILERQCGRPVPVGIAFEGDDSAPGWAKEATGRANPPGLATGMERWMQGRTDQQREAERLLFEDTGRLPFEEQASFWARVILEIIPARDGARGNTLSPQVGAMALSAEEIAARVALTPARRGALVRHLIPFIEALGGGGQPSAERLTADEARRVAPSLLPIIEGLTGSPRRRRAIGEDVVERLYRLWEDL
ncbi:MAG: hypothetical protein H7145_02655, partial [Akkermansiaceae bacterium]|nr:hypothetical protein [Armatimonadota bacterium]